jgi:hypothetical protein
MAITYRVSKTKNPQGVEGVNYFANKFVKTSDYTFEELAEDINNSTTVTQADSFIRILRGLGLALVSLMLM